MSNSFAVPYADFQAQNAAVRDELRGAFDEVLDSGHYIQGPNVTNFEREFASYCESPHATGLANGTCSLHLVLRAMGVGPGDEVITAPNSFFASAAAIALVGAKIVFADVNDDANIDPDAIEAAVTDRTKVIMPVHLTGRPVDMIRIQDVADRHNLLILEDAAQAVGSAFRGQRVGSWGTAATFSLHPLKSLHAFGDAGILTAQDAGLVEDVAMRKNHGLIDRGTCAVWSFNCRLDEVQAALLRVQLRSLDTRIAERRRLAQRYNEMLHDWVDVPVEREGEYHSYQTYLIQANDRDHLQEHLRDNGVEAVIHYPTPLHLQPAAAELGYEMGSFPVTERLSHRVLSLPLFPGMSVAQQDMTVDVLSSFYNSRGGANR